jgi:hypothetical protein
VRRRWIGAKLIVINSSDTKIGEVAEVTFRGWISVLKGIAKALIAKGLKVTRNWNPL